MRESDLYRGASASVKQVAIATQADLQKLITGSRSSKKARKHVKQQKRHQQNDDDRENENPNSGLEIASTDMEVRYLKTYSTSS